VPAVHPAPDRPDLLDHPEQKGGGQPEQNHSVQCLESSHHLPVRFKKYVRVAIGRDRAEGVEHSRPVVGQRADDPVGCRPDGSLERKQYCHHQCCCGHDRHEQGREVPRVHLIAHTPDDPLINHTEAEHVGDHGQNDQRQAHEPIGVPSGV